MGNKDNEKEEQERKDGTAGRGGKGGEWQQGDINPYMLNCKGEFLNLLCE